MNAIDFRNFRKKDTQRLAELGVDAWPIVSSLVAPQDVSKLMEAYVKINRIGSTWFDIATLNDEIVGFLFGKLTNDLKFVHQITSIIPSLIILLKIIVGKYGRLSEPFIFLQKLFATEQKVLQHTPNADGEITLFVVDADHRGKGIGRALLNRFINKAAGVNAKLISVYTDPLSNWKFYEKMGFKKHGVFSDDLNTYIKKREIEGFIYTISL